MSVIRGAHERLTRITESTPSLRPGQIVQGKILKIYPNHRAELQIGSQKLIAQLEAPLAVGERYHFQVANTQEMIELKVLGTTLKSESFDNVAQLLNELNVSGTRSTTQFVQLLLNEKMPFTKQELQQATQLLQQSNGSQAAQQVLFAMLNRQLPMTESVFNALLVNKKTTVTNEFTDLLNMLQNKHLPNDTHAKLSRQLTDMLSGSPNQTNRLVHLLTNHLSITDIEQVSNQLVNHRNTVLSHMQTLLNDLPTHSTQLTQFNIERAKIKVNQMPLSQDVKQVLLTLLESDRSQFLNAVRLLTDPAIFKELQSFVNQGSVQQQFLTHIQQFTQMSGLAYENIATKQMLAESNQQIDHQLDALVAMRTSIQKGAKSVINKWAHIFEGSQQSMIEEQVNTFKRDVQEQVIRLLPEGQRNHLLNLLQNNESLDKVWNFIQTLNRDETFTQMNEQLKAIRESNVNLTQQMINKMPELNTLLKSLHISSEVLQQNDANEQLQQTIKGMLLQLVHQSDPALTERAQQALHFINGLQLNSVHETSHFIQAALQIPGEPLNLNGDLYMDFESKKTEDGQIDPDYCRILFFLNLNALQDTVIDMHVQKRFVTLTIYNEHTHLNHLAKSFYKPLRDGLATLDYQLSTIRFKPLTEKDSSIENQAVNYYESETTYEEGVDFRI